MCGRYASFLPAEAVARLFHTTNPLPNVRASWNMAPPNADVAEVIRQQARFMLDAHLAAACRGERRLSAARTGRITVDH